MNKYWLFDSNFPNVLELTENNGAIISVCISKNPPKSPQNSNRPILEECAKQLREYFAENRHSFNLPIAVSGTVFQQAVWSALCRIPFGETRSYSEVAQMSGRPNACRAVGSACHANPILIIVPCHRVTAKNALGGFGAGIDNKKILLKLECPPLAPTELKE